MYKENDNLDMEAIEKYRKMTQEERDKLIAEHPMFMTDQQFQKYKTSLIHHWLRDIFLFSANTSCKSKSRKELQNVAARNPKYTI